MPFRFEIELKAKDARLLWTKTIHSFLSIMDCFKITIRQSNNEKSRNELIFSVNNKTKTTLMCTTFNESFFKSFIIQGELPLAAPENDDENRGHAFSFWVNTKDMDILFKDCADDSEHWKIFLICADEISNQVYNNRMFVEFTTKSGMVKKYSINYQQGYPSFNLQYRFAYHKILKMQNKENNLVSEPYKVNRIAIDPNILKRFLGMFPASLQDFKIEIYPNRGSLKFSGFNRQELLSKSSAAFNHKDKSMTLDIMLLLEDINFSNINPYSTNEEQLNDSIHVSFRLRDFKSFVSLVSSNLSHFMDTLDTQTKNIGTGHNLNTPVLDVMFTIPGEPIIVERCYFLDMENEMAECCKVTLIEITDSESSMLVLEGNSEIRHVNVNSNDIKASKHPAKSGKNDKENLFDSNERLQVINNGPLFVPDDDVGGVGGDGYGDAGGEENRNQQRNADYTDDGNHYEKGEGIDANVIDNYGEHNFETEDYNVLENIRDKGKEHDSIGVDQLFMNNDKYHQAKVVDKRSIKRKLIDSDDVQNELNYLGPTQTTSTIKGIFD